ncbi:unnamed protein product [Lampetra planeri]
MQTLPERFHQNDHGELGASRFASHRHRHRLPLSHFPRGARPSPRDCRSRAEINPSGSTGNRRLPSASSLSSLPGESPSRRSLQDTGRTRQEDDDDEEEDEDKDEDENEDEDDEDEEGVEEDDDDEDDEEEEVVAVRLALFNAEALPLRVKETTHHRLLTGRVRHGLGIVFGNAHSLASLARLARLASLASLARLAGLARQYIGARLGSLLWRRRRLQASSSRLVARRAWAPFTRRAATSCQAARGPARGLPLGHGLATGPRASLAAL